MEHERTQSEVQGSKRIWTIVAAACVVIIAALGVVEGIFDPRHEGLHSFALGLLATGLVIALPVALLALNAQLRTESNRGSTRRALPRR